MCEPTSPVVEESSSEKPEGGEGSSGSNSSGSGSSACGAAAMSSSSSTPSAKEAPPPPRNGRRTWLIAAAVGVSVVGLAVGLGVGLSRRGSGGGDGGGGRGGSASQATSASGAGDAGGGGGGSLDGAGNSPTADVFGGGGGGVSQTTTTTAVAPSETTTTSAATAAEDAGAESSPSSTPSSAPNSDDNSEKKKHLGPPNILFLYSDQHQGACLGSEGHPDVLTPHLDSLASSGVRFTRAYVNDGICAPSRQSLMSGLYPRTLGCLDNSLHPLTEVQKEARSLAETLQSNGYATAAIGKRHLGTQAHKGLDEGWDVHFSHRLGRDKVGTYYQWIEDSGENPDTGDTYLEEFTRDREACDDADLCTRGSELPPDKTMEAWTAKKSIEYIRERAAENAGRAANETRPFFLWSTFFRPHQPYNPQPKYEKMYEDAVPDYKDGWGPGLKNRGQIKMPSNLEQPREDLPRGLEQKRKSTSPPWNCGTAAEDHQIYRDYMAAYYALVTEIDDHVGEILRVLEEEGMADNTVVIYTSDHGDFAGRHGLASKVAPTHTTYEEIYRVPLIVRYPHHFPGGNVVDDLTEAVDLYPTLLDLAQIEDKDDDGYPLQGKSLVPTMTSPSSNPTGTEYIVAENWSSMTIITKEYKLTKWLSGKELHPEESKDYSDNPNLLFDRSYDQSEGPAFPSEVRNLYDLDEYRDVRDRLEGWMDDWIETTNRDGLDEKFDDDRRRRRRRRQ